MKATRMLFAAAAVSAVAAFAQTPQINPLEPASITPAPSPAARANDNGALTASLKALEELRAGNAEILQKQQATMQLLDQLTKDADQLRIFSKRG